MDPEMKQELKRIAVGTGIFLFKPVLLRLGILPNESIHIIQLVLYLTSYLILGAEIFKECFNDLLHGRLFNENFLMTIASAGAIALGDFSEAIFVILFYTVGELVQDYAVERSHNAIHALLDLRPEQVNRRNENGFESIAPEKVAIGDVFLVRSGERIPLDGSVIEGTSATDLSALTGEAMPIAVKPGDKVLSGGINIGAPLIIRAEAIYSESTASRILEYVEEAENRKANSEKFITRFAKIYTPMIVFSALFLAVIPPLFFRETWSVWIHRALVFLVTSCPCALVISIPLCFLGGIGGASRNGILIKGSIYLESLSRVHTVVMDKTGTLTNGRFTVKEIYPAEGFTESSVLEWTAYAEAYSTHPVSRAILNNYTKSFDYSRIQRNTEIPGKGISAIIDDQSVFVGNQKLMNEKGITICEPNSIGTVIHTALNGKYIGSLVIGDSIKPEAERAIKALRNTNVDRIVMLTGDKQEAAKEVSEHLHLDAFYAELLPQEKAEKLQSIMKKSNKNETTAFIGDGINDAPVLATADVGIAMGAFGTAAAIEAANVVLMNDDLIKISQGIRGAKQTMKILRENIIFSISIKIAVLILAAFGFSGMTAAVLADTGTALIVILNSLRTLKKYL